jgi:hypothetical protein
MTGRARVFVSHSSHTAGSRAYLDAITHAIEAEKGEFELLVDDSTLAPGDEWRSVIYRWLDQAHAAVVLMSDDALASPWVDIEISILSFQYLRGRTLKIIPVMLADTIDEQAIAAKLQFRETFQFFKPRDEQDAAEGVLRALREPTFLDKVRKAAPPARTAQAFIADRLEEARFDRDLLDTLAGSVPEGISTARAACEFYAQTLLATEFGPACADLVKLGRELSASNDRFGGSLVSIVNILKPSWVSPVDASVVAECINSSGDRVLALSAGGTFVAESLVRRAQGRPARWDERQVVAISPPSVQDELSDVREQLYAKYKIDRGDDGRPLSSDEKAARLARKLKNLDAAELRVCLVFPDKWVPTWDFLKRLRTEFQTVTSLFAGFAQGPRFQPPIASLRELTKQAAVAAEDDYNKVYDVYGPL